MAITNTRSIYRIEVQDTQPDPEVMVLYMYTFDDPDDDELPVSKEKSVLLKRYVTTTDEDGNETQTATDVSSHMQIVQDICAAIWTD